MPPRRNPALAPPRNQIGWDFIARSRRPAPVLEHQATPAEPSPLVEALKQYLEALP